MNSRRLIASPKGSEQGIVAGQTGWPEVDKTALGDAALGQKQTSEQVRVMSALPPKADMTECDWHSPVAGKLFRQRQRFAIPAAAFWLMASLRSWF